MDSLKIVIDNNWLDSRNNKTEALSLDIDRQYTISEFIVLLEEAKKKWGDKTILIHDMNNNGIGGFSTIYLDHGLGYIEEYDEYDDDKICIYG